MVIMVVEVAAVAEAMAMTMMVKFFIVQYVKVM